MKQHKFSVPSQWLKEEEALLHCRSVSLEGGKGQAVNHPVLPGKVQLK